MRSSISVGLCAFALALSASAMARPDLNSFVNRRVTDTNSLIGQIKSDPEVSDRYQRHFSMNRQELIAYLSDLHRAPLSESGSYPVYSVPKDGHVKLHMEKLKKGEPMFVNASGKPILIAKCGNPVVLGPSRSRRGNPVVVTTTEPSGGRAMVFEEPRPSDVLVPSDLVAMMPPVPPVVDAPPIVNEVPPPPVDTVPVTSTGGGGRFPWFAGLPLLIPIFGGGHHGGGGTNSTPEPATMIALGVGMVALVRKRRRS